ncbi:MAG: DUF218 domain-containing protein [Lachnospiraceae bacterium]|nr:DUF218 domain-containing protein [Lachnospiraceae bacterium]
MKHLLSGKYQWLKRGIFSLMILGILGILTLTGINIYVKGSVSKKLYKQAQADRLPKVDCIMVLGAGLKEDGSPNFMLKDRLNAAISLYQKGISNRLLMTGDHGREDYNEVQAMKDYAIQAGIPADDIFMDHAGFSTYESAYRAKNVFQISSAVIITQKYHLYRALYCAERLGINAYGMTAKEAQYGGQWIRDAREVVARSKDVAYCLFRKKPTYLGEPIPITGRGSETDD